MKDTLEFWKLPAVVLTWAAVAVAYLHGKFDPLIEWLFG